MNLSSMYAQDMLKYVLVAVPIWLVFRVAYLRLRHTQTTVRREVVLGMCALYAVGLLSQTVLPPGTYGFDDGALYVQPIIRPEAQYNLVPGRSILSYAVGTNDQVSDWHQVSVLNLLGNVFLFAPVGFLMPLLSTKCSRLWHVAGVGLAGSVMIETIQLFSGRSADIDDVILNTLGICIGYVAVTTCVMLMQRSMRAKLNSA